MTPEEEAYKLAEARIAEAHTGKYRYVNLAGEVAGRDIAGEIRFGAFELENLVRLPPSIGSLVELRRLDLVETRIADLRFLEKLEGLEELWLNSTPVSDIGPLAALKSLQQLGLHNTRVSDLLPIEKLEQLRWLESGERISVVHYDQPIPGGVDTAEDLQRVRAAYAEQTI